MATTDPADHTPAEAGTDPRIDILAETPVGEGTPRPWDDRDFSCPDCGQPMQPRDNGPPAPHKPTRIWACPAGHRAVNQYRPGEEPA